MNFSSYLGKEKISDQEFVHTFKDRISKLSNKDIEWALHESDCSDNENVQSLLMDMVFSFYATDLVMMKNYEEILNIKLPISEMNVNQLQAYLIYLFHQDRVVENSLIHDGIGRGLLLEVLCQLEIKLYN